MLQRVYVRVSVLRCVAVCCSVLRELMTHDAVFDVAACVCSCECNAVRCSVLKFAAVWCTELLTRDVSGVAACVRTCECVAVRSSVLQCVAETRNVSDVAACVRACKCVAVCCSVLKHAAVCSRERTTRHAVSLSVAALAGV